MTVSCNILSPWAQLVSRMLSPVQTDATLLANNYQHIVGCYKLRPFAHPVACCWATFETGQTFQPTTPKISFVPWSLKRSATMLDSSNIVGATHAQYAWFTKTCGLHPSHDALQAPTLYGAVLITVRVDLSAFYRARFTPVRLKVSNCDDVGRHVKKCPKTHTILRKTSWSSKFIALRAIMTVSRRNSPQLI